jgi:hypothetical protein
MLVKQDEVKCSMRFEIQLSSKMLAFDSELRGLKVDNHEYLAGQDGILIYDKTGNIQADRVDLQMSTNTSTLIPSLRILDLPYHPYFDERVVVESQNDITFYWDPSKLAAFYNRFSTDGLEFPQREAVIRRAVEFLTKNVEDLPLPEEVLSNLLESCKLLGFYQGFPVFDSSAGFAKLQSRLGIHVGTETIMVSTPLDRYESDVYELAEQLIKETGLKYSKKKNRVSFPKDPSLLSLLNLEN